MATYRIKLFSKKKDNKKQKVYIDDVPFIDRFRIKAGRIGDKAFFVPENYREDYARALKKRDMDDFLEKYKGYHTKAELAIGGLASGALAGWAYNSAKKDLERYPNIKNYPKAMSPKKQAALVGGITAGSMAIGTLLGNHTKLGRGARAANMEMVQDMDGKKYLEKDIALNKAIGSKKSEKEYMNEFAKAARKNGKNSNFGIGAKDRYKKYYLSPSYRSNND